ncbi:hypothetical protein Tco_0718176 [Tanacetum coccineum]
MKRGFAGNHVPLFPAMLAGATPDQGEGSAITAEPQHTPDIEVPQPQDPTINLVADEATTISMEVEAEGATTTIPSLDAGLDSGNIHESPLRSHEAPIPEGHTSGSAEDSLKLKELSELVPKLELRIDHLEKELQETKQTLGSAVIKLVKKVKSLEVALKRKTKKVIVSNSEDEETESHGRIIRDIDDDPLVSLAKASMDESAADFNTPSNLGEAQEKDISPTTMEAARTLTQVTSEGLRTYKRRTKSTEKGKNINTGLDAKAAINTSSSQVKSGSSQVKSGSVNLNADKGQREGKAPMTIEEVQAIKKTKVQLEQERVGLEEDVRLQAQMDEEVAKQIHMDKMVAKRLQEEMDLSKKQKKRKDQRDLDKGISKKQKIIHVSESAEDVAKVASKEQEEDSETDKEEHTEAIDVTPIATKAHVVVNWKIFQQGQRIISREDLTELYRLLMQKYGLNRHENVNDRVLWSDLRTIFDPPLSEDAI